MSLGYYIREWRMERQGDFGPVGVRINEGNYKIAGTTTEGRRFYMLCGTREVWSIDQHHDLIEDAQDVLGAHVDESTLSVFLWDGWRVVDHVEF